MSNKSSNVNRIPSIIPIALGGIVGLAFYFVVALGVFYLLLGPGGKLIPDDGPESGYWAGRVMSSWINLFSFMAFFIAIALLITRRIELAREQSAFRLNVMGDDEETLLLPEDAQECRKALKKLSDKDQSLVVINLLKAGLQRARANWSAEDAGQAIKTQAELVQGQTESEYSFIRYLAWAIPSIGFIGTVLGIGQAMGSLEGDKETDMMAVAAGHLSTAFDTTFVALVLSLILMYVLHKVQSTDDAFLVRAIDYSMKRLVYRMHIRSPEMAR